MIPNPNTFFETALNMMVEECHEIARQHGFWDDEKDPSPATRAIARLAYDVVDLAFRVERVRKPDAPYPHLPLSHVLKTLPAFKVKLLSKLVLHITETAEAIEAVLCSPDNSVGNLAEELVDEMIRVCDTAGVVPKTENIGHLWMTKNLVNKSRPYRHGKLA